MDEDRHSPRDIRLFSVKWNVGFIVTVSIAATGFLIAGLWAVSLIMGTVIAYSTYVLADDIMKLRKGIDSD